MKETFELGQWISHGFGDYRLALGVKKPAGYYSQLLICLDEQGRIQNDEPEYYTPCAPPSKEIQDQFRKHIAKLYAACGGLTPKYEVGDEVTYVDGTNVTRKEIESVISVARYRLKDTRYEWDDTEIKPYVKPEPVLEPGCRVLVNAPKLIAALFETDVVFIEGDNVVVRVGLDLGSIKRDQILKNYGKP